MKKVYVASGWFNERDDRILTSIEDKLMNMEGITPYRPRKDGIELTSEQFHDHALRKGIFESNVVNIDDSDFLVVNLDCGSARLDTGTVWECSRAVSLGIPVIVYDETQSIEKRLHGISKYLPYRASNLNSLEMMVNAFMEMSTKSPRMLVKSTEKPNPLVLCDKTGNIDLVATILDTVNTVRVIPDPESLEFSSIESLFDNTSCVVIPTDTKSSILTWYMGMAYALNIPIFTYSDTNSPLNLMLVFSVVSHLTDLSNVTRDLSLFIRQGLSAFGEYDTSTIRVY